MLLPNGSSHETPSRGDGANSPADDQTLVIVHASVFPVGAKGHFQHGVATKLSNGLIRNGHLVLNFSDREIARALSVLGHRKYGAKKANHVFRNFCREHQPDVLLLGHADSLLPETIAAVRADLPRLRVVQWNVDPVFEPDNIRRIASKLDVVDATLVSTAGEALAPLRRPGRALGFLPNPVDLSIERGTNHLKRDLPYDLFYACGNPREPLRNVCGQDWDMERLVQGLINDVPGLRPCLGGLLGHKHLGGAAFQRALESTAIGLNISRRGDYLLYSSDRLAQTIGNGQAIVIERATGYDRLFTAEQMCFFSSLDEMKHHVRHLVADPAYRQALAAAGRERYLALFNERLVARYVLDVALGCHDATRYEWPTLIP